MRIYTTAEAAQVANYTVKGFAAMMVKLRQRGGPDWRIPGPDARSIRWDADAIDNWAAKLPKNRKDKRSSDEPSRARQRPAPRRPEDIAQARHGHWHQPCQLPDCTGHHDLAQALEHAHRHAVTAEEIRLSAVLALLGDEQDPDDQALRRIAAAASVPLADVRQLTIDGDAPNARRQASISYYEKHPHRTPGVYYEPDASATEA